MTQTISTYYYCAEKNTQSDFLLENHSCLAQGLTHTQRSSPMSDTLSSVKALSKDRVLNFILDSPILFNLPIRKRFHCFYYWNHAPEMASLSRTYWLLVTSCNLILDWLLQSGGLSDSFLEGCEAIICDWTVMSFSGKAYTYPALQILRSLTLRHQASSQHQN